MTREEAIEELGRALLAESTPKNTSRRRAQHCRPLSIPQKARRTARMARFFGYDRSSLVLLAVASELADDHELGLSLAGSKAARQLSTRLGPGCVGKLLRRGPPELGDVSHARRADTASCFRALWCLLAGGR